jgi:hypothetical protein
VEHDIGVAVPGETARMRYRNAAEHDRPLTRKGVDVKAHCSTGDEARGKPLFRQHKVLCCRQLVERRVSGDDRHFMAGISNHLSIVGRLCCRRPLLMSGDQRLENEGLRSLHSD